MNKKKWLLTSLCFLVISSLVFFQNCAKKADSGQAANALSCDQAGISGTWFGSISGNNDATVIASNCAASSTYCSSNSTINIIQIGSNCPSGSNSCGTAEVRTNSSNGYQGCLPQGSNVICAFVTHSNEHNLTFNCGNSSFTYSR